MRKKLMLMLIVVLLVGMLSTAFRIPNVKAATVRSFHLYGSFSQGWGFTQGSMSIPGPMIEVEQDDTVNLTLTSTDSLTHRFFLSYHNNTTPSSWRRSISRFHCNHKLSIHSYQHGWNVHVLLLLPHRVNARILQSVPNRRHPRIPASDNSAPVYSGNIVSSCYPP